MTNKQQKKIVIDLLKFQIIGQYCFFKNIFILYLMNFSIHDNRLIREKSKAKFVYKWTRDNDVAILKLPINALQLGVPKLLDPFIFYYYNFPVLNITYLVSISFRRNGNHRYKNNSMFKCEAWFVTVFIWINFVFWNYERSYSE